MKKEQVVEFVKQLSESKADFLISVSDIKENIMLTSMGGDFIETSGLLLRAMEHDPSDTVFLTLMPAVFSKLESETGANAEKTLELIEALKLKILSKIKKVPVHYSAS
jgi:hypothetical protein